MRVKEYGLVSICIPTYNGAPFLKEALDSILDQSYENIEVVISDDSSTDGTLEIIKNFKANVDIPVHLYHHTPNGIGANWNNCIYNASGKFIKFLFQDDVLYSNCIMEMISVFDDYPEIGLVASKREFILEESPNAQSKEWLENYANLQTQFEEEGSVITIIDSAIFKENYFYLRPFNKVGEPTAVMFKKEIVAEIGYFDLDMQQILDYVFYYKLLKRHKIIIINRPLVAFRLHNQQATNINRERSIPDYQLYDQLLYDSFLNLLNPNQKHRLKSKFNKSYRLYNRMLDKLKGINNRMLND